MQRPSLCIFLSYLFKALSQSLNLNGSLNNSLTMAQLSRRELPQLPSSLDKNRLPKIPGMESGIFVIFRDRLLKILEIMDHSA